MAGLAEFESEIISENVKAGMARARSEGKRIGRATITAEQIEHIDALHAEGGHSVRSVAEQVGVSIGTAHSRLSELKKARAK